MPIVYLGIWAFVRIFGKRTLANLNAFDLLVTVAVGSTAATVVVDSSISYAAGAAAIAFPLVAQYVVASVASRSNRAERFIKAQPSMLLWDGKVLQDMLEHEMITEHEIDRAVRKAGLSTLREVQAVVLEVDGELSVIRRSEVPHSDEDSVVNNVKRTPHHQSGSAQSDDA